MKKSKIPNTQLIIGAADATGIIIDQQLKTLFCVQDAQAHCVCVPCKQIIARQHHAIRWHAPEKQQYTLAQLESIFDQVRFSLDPDDSFVFILEQVDALSLVCANSLLKTLEEPSEGYYFFLTTQYPTAVLPTIYSRCVVQECGGDNSIAQANQFLSFFKNPQKNDLHECIKELDRLKIAENQTKMLMDILIQYWLQQYTRAIECQDGARARQALRYMDILTHFLNVLPMPGSAKLFWKTIYTTMLF